MKIVISETEVGCITVLFAVIQ